MSTAPGCGRRYRDEAGNVEVEGTGEGGGGGAARVWVGQVGVRGPRALVGVAGGEGCGADGGWVVGVRLW